MTNVSALGLQLQMVSSLQSQESVLDTLTDQLGTGTQHTDLTDYAPTDVVNLLSFQDAITQKQSYLATMNTVQTRLTLYDSTMTDMESIAAQANTLAAQNQSYDPTTATQISAEATSYLKQVSDDLNQQTNGRYIYAGTRYSTQPVVDLTTLVSPPSATIAANPALPVYDTEYQAGTTSDANAYVADSVLVDSNYSVTYGVSSDDPSFQKIIAGLRFMNSAVTAGQAGNTATYASDMQQATSLLSSGLTGVQTLHAGVASSQNTLTEQTATQTNDVTNLQDQITNIQQVDLTQVGAEIQQLQTQLEASYSATASIEQLSLTKYLS